VFFFAHQRQVNLKKELFQGQNAKKSLKALKLLYNIPGPIFLNEWCRQVRDTTHVYTRTHTHLPQWEREDAVMRLL
jgi:hypothetical protein